MCCLVVLFSLWSLDVLARAHKRCPLQVDCCPGVKGPTCQTDADCRLAGCLRCAKRSKTCTDVADPRTSTQRMAHPRTATHTIAKYTCAANPFESALHGIEGFTLKRQLHSILRNAHGPLGAARRDDKKLDSEQKKQVRQYGLVFEAFKELDVEGWLRDCVVDRYSSLRCFSPGKHQCSGKISPTAEVTNH